MTAPSSHLKNSTEMYLSLPMMTDSVVLKHEFFMSTVYHFILPILGLGDNRYFLFFLRHDLKFPCSLKPSAVHVVRLYTDKLWGGERAFAFLWKLGLRTKNL